MLRPLLDQDAEQRSRQAQRQANEPKAIDESIGNVGDEGRLPRRRDCGSG